MMDAVTYSLKCGHSNSEAYYQDVRAFTDILLTHSEKTFKPVIDDFTSFLQTYKLEEVREYEEYLLELISFGVLWKSYSNTALSARTGPFVTLARMAEWRKKHQRAKPYIDLARGILTTLFLLPKNSNHKPTQIPTLEQIDHVCKWFEATGEFREQALRFIRWRAFWGTKTSEELFQIFFMIDEYTKWFETESEKHLGKYTEEVEKFLERKQKFYRWREDRIQCTRARIEYHLNMAGAELMNRAFRKDFDKTDMKVVLVPGCMRKYMNIECKAKRVREGLICEGCSPECNVNQLREMGKKNSTHEKFEVYIIPHASDLSLWSPREGRHSLGVVASACVTTLVEGGWELKRYDVPAQCVLLDNSGCKKHWHDEGIPTKFNVRELKRIIAQ